jgi:hypothetical protein
LSSATIIATKRNIAARQRKIAAYQTELRRTSPRNKTRRSALGRKIKQIQHEVSTLRASLSYYKPTEELAEEIKQQTKQVRSIRIQASRSRGARKKALLGHLQAAIERLNELLAAAAVKASGVDVKAPALPTAPPAPSLIHPQHNDPVSIESDDVDGGVAAPYTTAGPTATPVDSGISAEGSGPGESADSSGEAASFPDLSVIQGGLSQAASAAGEAWDELPDDLREMRDYLDDVPLPGEDKDGTPFYKNPFLWLAGGTILYFILRRKS